MTRKDYDNWYNKLPPGVQIVVDKYPLGTYEMTADAPYGLSCPGTIVYPLSYLEDELGNCTEMRVVVKAENKLPAGLAHEKMLCIKHGKDPEEMHKRDMVVAVELRYLKLITAEEITNE